jgi:hypothetical protein
MAMLVPNRTISKILANSRITQGKKRRVGGGWRISQGIACQGFLQIVKNSSKPAYAAAKVLTVFVMLSPSLVSF